MAAVLMGRWKTVGSIVRGSAFAAAGVRSSITKGKLRKGARRAASGVLAPGDPDPPPDGPIDYYDYRGVAVWSETRHELGLGQFPLGWFIDPRRGPSARAQLSFEILKQHAAVVGPTGSGKTKSILVPWIAAALKAGYCVVAVDVSGDLLQDLAVHRMAVGRFGAAVAKWDYTDPRNSVSWNWLTSLDSDEAVDDAAIALCGKPPPNDPQPFFHQRDIRFMRALLAGAVTSPNLQTGKDLLNLVMDQRAFESFVHSPHGAASRARLTDFVGLPASDYQKAVSGAVNALEIWDNVGLDAVTRRDGLDLDSLFDRPSLLVVGAPIHGGSISQASSSLMISQVINRLYRRFTHSRGRHVFLVLDEAARLKDRINLEEVLSVSRRARVSVVLGIQDVSQLGDEKDRVAILGNCATYIALPSSSSTNAAYLSGRLGQRPQSAISINETLRGSNRGTGVTNQIGTVPVLGDREILSPPFGALVAVVHSRKVSYKPFLVELSRAEFL